MRCFIALVLLLLVAGCVEHPPHREQGSEALLFSWTPIIRVDGEAPQDPYRLMLQPGRHDIQVQYRSYRRDYLCHFSFEAQGGWSYEVVDHSNEQPLVLYRSVRGNAAWVERRDPVMPRCVSSLR